MLAGVDACRSGWMAVIYDGAKCHIDIYSNIEKILKDFPSIETLFIDIPVGLASLNNPRTIDSILRKQLKGRASTVFTPPCRDAISLNDHQKASELNKRITGKGLSIQSYHIMPRIADVDRFILEQAYSNLTIYESHPELCFKMLNKNREVVMERKNTREGQEKRLQVLHMIPCCLNYI